MNIKTKKMKKITFIILALVSGIFASTAQITLSFNPDKGATYKYTINMAQKIKQNIMGQDMDMNQNMVMDYDMAITEKNKDEIKTTFSYTNVYYELINPMMNMKYDSNNAENLTGMDAMMGKIFGSLLNKQFEVIFLPNGTVKSLTGMDAIVDDMMKAIGGDMMAQQVGESMKAQFSNEAMMKNFEQSFKMYPDSPVKAGSSWEVEQNTESGGISMALKSSYTLKEIDNKKAIIHVSSEINGMEGMLKGTQEGDMILNIATGLPETAKVVQNLGGTVSANGMDVTMSLESLITTSAKEK